MNLSLLLQVAELAFPQVSAAKGLLDFAMSHEQPTTDLLSSVEFSALANELSAEDHQHLAEKHPEDAIWEQLGDLLDTDDYEDD